MSMSPDELNTMNWVCVGPLLLLVVAIVCFLVRATSPEITIVEETQTTQRAADELATSDGEPRIVADNVVYEIPAVNPWSVVYTGQHIYAPNAPEEEPPTSARADDA